MPKIPKKIENTIFARNAKNARKAKNAGNIQ